MKLADSGDPDVMFREGVSQLDNAGGERRRVSESALSEVNSTCLGGVPCLAVPCRAVLCCGVLWCCAVLCCAVM